jgi:hypothetical protein
MQRRYTPVRPWKLDTDGAGAFLTITDPVSGAGTWSAFGVEIVCTLTDWTPAAEVNLCRQGTTDGNLCWSMDLAASGRPTASYYDLGTNATRITGTATADPRIPLVNGRPYGLRAWLLSDFLGVASAYVFEINYGARWENVGGITSAGIVGTPFDSSEPVSIGIPVSFTELHHFRVYAPIFGVGQLHYSRIVADAGLSLHSGDTAWTDRFGNAYTLGAAEWTRNDNGLLVAAA